MESVNSKLIKIRKDIDKSPTEGQKESGNYKKGHISINGFKITIENPKGSYRKGVDSNGKEWKTKMNNDYGYFNDSVGYDGDHVDVFLGSDFESEKIFVVDQKKGNKFDESKVMLGFNTEKEAKNAYLSNYEKGWNGFHKITEVSINDFKEWLYDGKKQRKPFYQYKDIKKNTKKMKIKIKESVLRQLIQESINKVVVNEIIDNEKPSMFESRMLKENYDNVYTMDNWRKDGSIKLKIGQYIDDDVFEELANSVPPTTYKSLLFQPGEAYTMSKDYEDLYMTFVNDGNWKYVGLCPKGSNKRQLAYDEKEYMGESIIKESRGLKSMKLYQIAKEHGGFNKDICFGKSFYLNDFTDDDVIGVVSEEELDALDGSVGDLNDYAIEKGYQVNKGDATQLLCMNDYTWVAVIERQSVGKYYDNSPIGIKKSLRNKYKTITDGSKDYPWSDHNKWFGSERKREFDRRKENLQ